MERLSLRTLVKIRSYGPGEFTPRSFHVSAKVIGPSAMAFKCWESSSSSHHAPIRPHSSQMNRITPTANFIASPRRSAGESRSRAQVKGRLHRREWVLPPTRGEANDNYRG